MNDKASYYREIRMVPYDLVKELALATLAVLVLVVILAIAFSSPDVPSVTVAGWAQADPIDFVTTAVSEISGSSTTAEYGPPYNHADGSVQSLWFLHPQSWAGVHIAVNPAQQFILQPLQEAASGDPALANALSTFQSAASSQQTSWLDSYTSSLANATVNNGQVAVSGGNYGPVPVLMSGLLTLAQNGGIDGLLLVNNRFYQTDYTRPLLFIADGGYFEGLAKDQKLTGSQWGMMNETGRYPGQTWLWLYTAWYQVPPFNKDSGFLGVNSANADLAVIVLMSLLSGVLMLTPFIPGLRDIPRWIPIHRLIWRKYYAELHRLQ